MITNSTLRKIVFTKCTRKTNSRLNQSLSGAFSPGTVGMIFFFLMFFVFVLFCFKLHFWNNCRLTCSHKKQHREIPHTPHWFSPVVLFYQTVVQHRNQDIDGGTVKLQNISNSTRSLMVKFYSQMHFPPCWPMPTINLFFISIIFSFQSCYLRGHVWDWILSRSIIL